jgi:hypothetical protein
METSSALVEGYGTIKGTIALETAVILDIVMLENAFVIRVHIKILQVNVVAM